MPAMRNGQLAPIIDLLSTRDGLLRLFGTALLAVFATGLMLAFQAVL